MDIDVLKLYELAKKKSETGVVFENIFSLYWLNRYSDAFRVLIRHPKLTVTDQVKILLALPCFKPSGSFEELLFSVLNHQLSDRIFMIHEEYAKVMDRVENIVIVQVFSSMSLSSDMKDFLKRHIENSLKKEIILYDFVQENLLAGMVVKLPNGKIFNFTFDKVLSDMKYQLMEAR